MALFISRHLANNPLGCTCQLISQLHGIKDIVQSGACWFPVATSGITLGIDTVANATYFTNSNYSLFQCSKFFTRYEPRHEKTNIMHMRKQKTQISFMVTSKLISAFVFATLMVRSLFFLNPKFQASSHLL